MQTGEKLPNGYGASFWGDENAELNTGGDCTAP